jgi:hypothetical protein
MDTILTLGLLAAGMILSPFIMTALAIVTLKLTDKAEA